MVMSKAPGGSDAGTQVADEGRSFGRLVGEASIPRVNVTTASAPLPLPRAALKNAAPGIKPAEFIRRHPYFYFPIRAGAKHPPCFGNNLNEATDKFPVMKQWAAKWPRCNWGLSVAKSGLVVADVDCKTGKNGRASYDRLIWPDTLMISTPSGGFHCYYRQTNAVRFVTSRQNIFGPESHVDAPGYVLIPGCTIEGGRYDVLRDLPIANAPDFLAEYLIASERGEAVEQVAVIELDQQHNIEWAIDHLQHDATPAIEGRGGERTLLMVAGDLKDHGISLDTAIDLIAEHYNPRCEPPWNLGDGELADRLDVKVSNAYRYLKYMRPGAATAEADFGDDAAGDATDMDTLEAERVKSSAWKAWRRRQSYTKIDGVWTRRHVEKKWR
jgi:hypothetical protein